MNTGTIDLYYNRYLKFVLFEIIKKLRGEESQFGIVKNLIANLKRRI